MSTRGWHWIAPSPSPRMLVGEAAAVGLSGSILGLLAGLVIGVMLTTSGARAVAGYRLDVAWPLVTMIAGPLLSTAAAAVVALRWTRGRAHVAETVGVV